MNFKECVLGYLCANKHCQKVTFELVKNCNQCGTKELRPFYDYYKIFQLEPNYTLDILKKKYKKLSLQYHPDIQKGHEKNFLVISEGYHILKDASKKMIYDQTFSLFHSQSSQYNSQNPPSSKGDFNTENFSQKDFLKNLYEIFEEMSKKQRENPAIRLSHQKRICSILGGLIGLSLSIIFSLSPYLMMIVGYFFGRLNTWLSSFLFAISDFLVFFISIFFIFKQSFSIIPTISVTLLLSFYYHLTQKWKNNYFP